MAAERIETKITTENIKLAQVLKLAGTVYSGAEAKAVILDGAVSVNGDVCLMRGKKIYPGDVVVFDADEDHRYEISVT